MYNTDMEWNLLFQNHEYFSLQFVAKAMRMSEHLEGMSLYHQAFYILV